ncbi:unnamed protein product, partial [Polarella glacialis]
GADGGDTATGPHAFPEGRPAACPTAAVQVDAAAESSGSVQGSKASAATVEPSEAAKSSLRRVKEEVDRILAIPASRPFEVLGLKDFASGYAVRSAFRRLALLVHPDKNPGYEERCKEALVRASEAREVAEASSKPGSATAGAGAAAQSAPEAVPVNKAAPAPRDPGPGQEPELRETFDSAEDFVTYALQFVFDDWLRYVNLALPPDSGTRQ